MKKIRTNSVVPIIIMSAKDSDSDKAFGLGLGAFAIIAVLAVFLFAQCYLGIANDPETGVPDSAPGMDTMMVQVEMFTNLCFLVFTAVMMSVFVIAPAKNGIRNLMFGYPIRQKQIIISEMAAVWIFCVAALAIGKTAIYLLLYLPSGSMEQSFRLGFDMMSRTFYVQVCLKPVLTVTHWALCVKTDSP